MKTNFIALNPLYVLHLSYMISFIWILFFSHDFSTVNFLWKNINEKKQRHVDIYVTKKCFHSFRTNSLISHSFLKMSRRVAWSSLFSLSWSWASSCYAPQTFFLLKYVLVMISPPYLSRSSNLFSSDSEEESLVVDEVVDGKLDVVEPKFSVVENPTSRKPDTIRVGPSSRKPEHRVVEPSRNPDNRGKQPDNHQDLSTTGKFNNE